MAPICIITNVQFSYIMEVDGRQIQFNGGDNADYFYKHYHGLGYTVEAIGWQPLIVDFLFFMKRFEPLIFNAKIKHPAEVPVDFVLDSLVEQLCSSKELRACIHTRKSSPYMATAVEEKNLPVTTHGHIAVMPVEYINFKFKKS